MSQILFPLSLIVFLIVPFLLAFKSNKMPDIDEINQDIPLAEEPVPNNFPKITVASLNCNSLNMATVNKQTKIRKFYGIVSLKTDISNSLETSFPLIHTARTIFTITLALVAEELVSLSKKPLIFLV